MCVLAGFVRNVKNLWRLAWCGLCPTYFGMYNSILTTAPTFLFLQITSTWVKFSLLKAILSDLGCFMREAWQQPEAASKCRGVFPSLSFWFIRLLKENFSKINLIALFFLYFAAMWRIFWPLPSTISQQSGHRDISSSITRTWPWLAAKCRAIFLLSLSAMYATDLSVFSSSFALVTWPKSAA